jgi:hypothetical protein
MRKVKNWFTILSGSLLAIALFPLCAEGAMYKYVDKKGTVNFTDCYDCIPKEYRNQIKRLREEPGPKTPGEPLVERGKGGTAESAPKEGASPSREADQERREAEQKAASEKAEQERRLQERQEKEKRMAELTEQIAAREEEIKNLRTTWMVYDRTKLYTLTGEIEDLKKEIQSIQDSLTTSK